MKSSDASGSSSMDQDSKESKCSRASKGKVYLDRLAVMRSKGLKREVTFNIHGEAIGKTGAELQSYIGMLARKNIKVSFEQWKDVPADVKDTVWNAVKLMFNVDDSYKNKCQKSPNAKWRQWKSTLCTDHIRPYEGEPEMLYDPPSGYGILKEDWKEFVISHMSEGSRKEQLTENKDVNRALLWKQARANKKGEFDGERLTHTVMKIDDFIRQKEEGVFSKSHPRDDILTQALEKLEHSCRVRAVGGFVTPTFYFNLNKDVRFGIGKDVAEMRSEFGKQMAEMNAKIIELQ